MKPAGSILGRPCFTGGQGSGLRPGGGPCVWTSAVRGAENAQGVEVVEKGAQLPATFSLSDFNTHQGPLPA